MTPDEAFLKDMELKAKVRTAITEKQPLDAQSIAKLDVCTLGSWLYGDGERRCQFIKTYKPCVDAHAEFHAQAAKAVKMINMGEYKTAEAMFAENSPFLKAYSALGAAYLALKKDAKL